MNKNAISKFAVWARRELISRVRQRAEKYGITENDFGDPNISPVDGRLYTPTEKSQREAFIARIKENTTDKENSFQIVVEEVAYTWFNRFIALRFMEVNEYLPSFVRVFSDEENNFNPQIIRQASEVELDGLDKQKVAELKEASNDEELFKYLIITQCNALNSILPFLFQKISDYTELLFPDFLLRKDSFIDVMLSQIPEEDWKDGVQIIGWLYQYYNSETKDQVFANLKNNIKISKMDIPAATQLFTPDWIVRYMVENSLGRFWQEAHPNKDLQSNWRYYLEEAPQDPYVATKLQEIRQGYKNISPEEITCIDPCSGSGHVLVYMFEVLLQIYLSCGYSVRDAVSNIVEKNLYGLDLDERATQLSYFAVMMFARKHDRRFFSRGIQPNVYPIRESNNIPPEVVDFFANGDAKLKADISTIISEMRDAKEYGSLINVSIKDFSHLYTRFDEIKNGHELYRDLILSTLLPIVHSAELLSRQYDAVVTNPPYMGSKGMSDSLREYVADKFKDYKSDLFSCFVVRCSEMCTTRGYLGFLTPYVWMFIQSYEAMRNFIYENKTIETLIQFEYSAFEEATVPICTFALKNSKVEKKGCYLRLTEFRGGMEVQREKTLEAINNHACGFYYETSSANFSKIPGAPVAYWVSDEFVNNFHHNKIGSYFDAITKGIFTGDNNRFLRIWSEVSVDKISIKWHPYSKGGSYRKWYGNLEYVINWENDAEELRNFEGSGLGASKYFSKNTIVWSKITSSNASFRQNPKGVFFDDASPALVSESIQNHIIGFLNSSVSSCVLKLAPTLNFQIADIKTLPINPDIFNNPNIADIVQQNIDICKADWDAFETSWDFKKHPLIRNVSSIEDAYCEWEKECNLRFNQLKANEEELNRIFIDIYGLQKELTPDVEAKDVSVRKADLERDIKSFISYAIGCMFGRYSLDTDGIAFAGGNWESSKYKTFIPDEDAIIPITDQDYFADDIVERFTEFVKVVYGEDNLEKNLRFIAKALGNGDEAPQHVLRNYFMKDFFADHCKVYQKRPIYWLFDSGKKNSFKALIYTHRYRSDTIARLRTLYLHEIQNKYIAEHEKLDKAIATTTGKAQTRAKKELNVVTAKEDELNAYEKKIHHFADSKIAIDLDDGVKHNYALFADVLAKIK